MKDSTKTILKGLGIGLGVVAIGGVVLYLVNRSKDGNKDEEKTKSKDKNRKMICSHMAKCDLPQSSKAQNNLKNIELLIENDIDIIELDILITRDGVPILFHDNTLERTTNGSGKVVDKTWNELKGIRYKDDATQGIYKLEDALELLRNSKKDIIFQLDKCEPSEIKRISSLGLLKGIEDKMLCKSYSFSPNQAYIDAGVKFMPIIPPSYVGRMNNERVIDEIVEKCRGFEFCELSFGLQDTLVLNGTLARKMKDIGCGLLGVAITGIKTTNPNINDSRWGDKPSIWKVYYEQMDCQVVMTDRPIAVKKYLETIV